jgi:hypothetical protein
MEMKSGLNSSLSFCEIAHKSKRNPGGENVECF